MPATPGIPVELAPRAEAVPDRAVETTAVTSATKPMRLADPIASVLAQWPIRFFSLVRPTDRTKPVGPVLSANSHPFVIFLHRASPLPTASLAWSRVEDEEHAPPAHALEPSYAVAVRHQTTLPTDQDPPARHGYGHSASKQRLGDVSSQGLRQELFQLLSKQPFLFLYAFVESGREQLLDLASGQWKQAVEISFSKVVDESRHSRLRYLRGVPEGLRRPLELDVFATRDPDDFRESLGRFEKTMTSSVAGATGMQTSTI